MSNFARYAVVIAACIVLAIPLGIGVCLACGLLLTARDGLTTRCPGCRRLAMRAVDGIRETYPTGKGTGLGYVCENCHARWFWSYDDRAWQDALGKPFEDLFG
jgi:hypothetical protein